MERRTLVKGVAWSVPVIAVAATAPAFAASRPLTCGPTAECKLPGDGSNTKDYAIRTNCTSQNGDITKVEVYDDKNKVWIDSEFQTDGTWLARGFNDSRRDRQVRITDSGSLSEIYTVAFPPC